MTREVLEQNNVYVLSVCVGVCRIRLTCLLIRCLSGRRSPAHWEPSTLLCPVTSPRPRCQSAKRLFTLIFRKPHHSLTLPLPPGRNNDNPQICVMSLLLCRDQAEVEIMIKLPPRSGSLRGMIMSSCTRKVRHGGMNRTHTHTHTECGDIS